MFILNEIVGIGDFSIMDNFRLIVIAAIFIGIIVVLLYLRSARGGRKRDRKHAQETNPYDRGSKEETHSDDALDAFMRIEEELKASKEEELKASKEEELKANEEEDFEDISDLEVEIEKVPDIDLNKELANIEGMEGQTGTKLDAGVKNIGAEFTTIIEGLISKIEEREEEVVSKVENVVDIRIQEVLSKINDRIDEVIQAQKNSTALVLEKMINSLRQKEETVFNKILEAIDDRYATSETLDTIPIEEELADTLSSQVPEVVVEKTVKKKPATKKKVAVKKKVTPKNKQVVKKKPLAKKKLVAKKTSASSKKPTAVEDKSIPLETLNTLPIEEKPVGTKSSKKSKKVVDEKVEFEEITESDLGTPGENSGILGKLASSLQLGGASVDISFPEESGDTEAVAEVPEKTEEEDDWEILSEVEEDLKAEEEGPITSSEKIEKNSPEEMVGVSDDLDILDLMKEDPIDISFPDESSTEKEIIELPEEIKKEPLIKPSGVKEGAKVEKKESIASSEVIGENILVDDTDSADFDIQEFLEELGNIPSGKDLESEK